MMERERQQSDSLVNGHVLPPVTTPPVTRHFCRLAAYLTPRLWAKDYWWVIYAASTVLGWAQVAVAATMKETLPEEKRRPFELRTANPFANTLLLFRNGPGLRSLGVGPHNIDCPRKTWPESPRIVLQCASMSSKWL